MYVCMYKEGIWALGEHSQHTGSYCNKLHHTATQCNPLQHTATRFNTLQNLPRPSLCCPQVYSKELLSVSLRHVLQRIAACCSVLQRVAACCCALQHVAACYNDFEYTYSKEFYPRMEVLWIKMITKIRISLIGPKHNIGSRNYLNPDLLLP